MVLKTNQPQHHHFLRGPQNNMANKTPIFGDVISETKDSMGSHKASVCPNVFFSPVKLVVIVVVALVALVVIALVVLVLVLMLVLEVVVLLLVVVFLLVVVVVSKEEVDMVFPGEACTNGTSPVLCSRVPLCRCSRCRERWGHGTSWRVCPWRQPSRSLRKDRDGSKGFGSFVLPNAYQKMFDVIVFFPGQV